MIQKSKLVIHSTLLAFKLSWHFTSAYLLKMLTQIFGESQKIFLNENRWLWLKIWCSSRFWSIFLGMKFFQNWMSVVGRNYVLAPFFRTNISRLTSKSMPNFCLERIFLTVEFKNWGKISTLGRSYKRWKPKIFQIYFREINFHSTPCF